MKMLTAALLGALAIATPAVAGAQNLLTNGGFEAADFSSWTLGNRNDFVGITADPSYVYGGKYGAFFGTTGSETTLTQTIATTVGETYTISFAIAYMGGETFNASARFGNIVLDSISDRNVADRFAGEDPFGYRYLSYAGVATSTSTALQFSFRNDESFFGFDEVSVEQGAPVPEPASWAMMILGFGAVGATMRRSATRRPHAA